MYLSHLERLRHRGLTSELVLLWACGNGARRLESEHSMREIVRGVQDQKYMHAGARIVKTVEAFRADIVMKVQPPDVESEMTKFTSGQTLFSMVNAESDQVPSFLSPLQEKDTTVIGVILIVGSDWSFRQVCTKNLKVTPACVSPVALLQAMKCVPLSSVCLMVAKHKQPVLLLELWICIGCCFSCG